MSKPMLVGLFSRESETQAFVQGFKWGKEDTNYDILITPDDAGKLKIELHEVEE